MGSPSENTSGEFKQIVHGQINSQILAICQPGQHCKNPRWNFICCGTDDLIFCVRDDIIFCGRDDLIFCVAGVILYSVAGTMNKHCSFSCSAVTVSKKLWGGKGWMQVTNNLIWVMQTQISSQRSIWNLLSVRFLAWYSFRVASVTSLTFSASCRHDVPLVRGGVQGLRDGAQGLRQGLPQHPEPESWNQVMTESSCIDHSSIIICFSITF